jgi:hypothetical protein
MVTMEDSNALLHLNHGVSLDNQDLLLLLDALETLPAINTEAQRAGRLSRQLALLLGRSTGYRLSPSTPMATFPATPAPTAINTLPPLSALHRPAA